MKESKYKITEAKVFKFRTHMKRVLLLVLFTIASLLIHAQNITSIMNKESKTLRLIYPQWQGGVVAHWMPDMDADDASRGYFLGAQLLKMFAPDSNQKTVEVPISLDIESHKIENGISGYRAIIHQSKAALELLREENPDRIVTLGGECSVSVVPFTYLADKYSDDVAIVWIDAHPDINLPSDSYTGYHAMALTACLGMGDKEIMELLLARFDPSKALLVGLRSWDAGMKERQAELNLEGLAPEVTTNNSRAVLSWLKTTGASKVVIHFDLDVIDPSEMIAGVGIEPNGMKIEACTRVINDIASAYDIVGLTIAEHMPRMAIKMKNLLNQMPLLK